MSKKIDENVVSFKFDNRDFEKNTAQSMKTLDKFKKNLDFTSANNSLDKLNQSAKSVSFAPLISGLNDVQAKFSAVDAMVFGFFSNLGGRISDAAVKLIKSSSIDQISTGWSAYEEKTKAVQTIMAATSKEFEGMSNQMEQVEERLDKLRWYTDETSYSFNDMTTNIGKFTSVGVKLDTAVTAMQGLANLVSISGGGAAQFSSAAYNIAQALGAGVMTALDWKTLENQNVATVEFRQNLIDAAVAAKTLTKVTSAGKTKYYVKSTGKKTEVTTANIRDTLKDKWLTNDVLLSAFNIYGEFTDKLKNFTDETGLMTSQMLEYIDQYRDGTLDVSKFANKAGVSIKEATKTLDELTKEEYKTGEAAFRAAQESKTLSDVMGYTAEAAKSSWSSFFEHFIGNYEEAKELWSAWAEDLYTIFIEPMDKLNDMLDDWRGVYNENYIQKVAEQYGFSAEMVEEAKKAYDMDDTREAYVKWFNSVKQLSKEDAASLFEIISTKSKQELLDNIDDYTTKFNIKSEDLLKAQEAFLKGSEKGYQEWVKNFRRLDEGSGWYLGKAIKNKLDGRTVLLEGVKNIWSSIMTIIEKAREALNEIFPPMTGNRLYDLTVKFKEFTEKLVITEDRAEKIKNIFLILLKPIRLIYDILKAGYKVVKFIAPYIWAVVKRIGNFIISILSYITGVADAIKTSEGFAWVIDKLKLAIEKIIEAFRTLYGVLKDNAGKATEWVKGNLSALGESLSKIPAKVDTAKGKVSSFFKELTSKKNPDGSITEATSAIEKLGNAAGNTKEKAKQMFSSVAEAISNAWKSFATSDFGAPIVKFIKGVGEELWSIVVQLWNIFKSNPVQFIKDLAGGVISVRLAVGMKDIIKTIKNGANSINAFRDSLTGMFKSFSGVLDRIKDVGLKKGKFQNVIIALKTLSLVIVALAVSLYLLSKVDSPEKIVAGISAIAGALTAIVFAVEKLANVDRINGSVIATLAVFAVAVAIIGSAIKKIAEVGNYSSIIAATLSMVAVLAVIGLLIERLSSKEYSEKSVKNIVFMAVMIKVFSDAAKTIAQAIAILAKFNWDQLIAPTIIILAVMAAIMGGMKLLADNSSKSKMASLTPVLLSMAASIAIIGGAIALIGLMPEEQMNRGGSVVAAIFAALIGSLVILSKAKTSITGAASTMLAMGVTMTMLYFVLKGVFNLTKQGNILNAVLAICGLMIALAASIRIASGNLGSGGQTVALSLAFMAIAASMLILVPVIAAFAKLGTGETIKAIIAVVALLGAIAIVIKKLSVTSPARLLAIGAAFLMIGASIGLIGGGLLLFSQALVLIAGNVALVVGALTALAAGVAAALTVFIVEFLKATPKILDALYIALEALMDFLTRIEPMLTKYVTKYVARLVMTGLETLLDILVEHGVPIAEKLVILIIDLLKALNKHVADFVEQVTIFIVNLIEAAAKNLPKIINAVMDFFAALYDGIMEAVESHDMGKVFGGIGFLALTLTTIAALGVLAAAAMVGIIALAACAGELAGVIAIFGAIGQIPGVKWILGEGGEVLGLIGRAIGSFVGGIIGGIVDTATQNLPELGNRLSSFMQNLSVENGFFDGISRITPEMETAMAILTASIIGLTVADFINAVADFLTFGNSLPELGNDLSTFMTNVKPFVDGADAIKDKSLDAIGSLVGAMVLITGADFLAGITRLLGGGHNLSDMSAQLPDFGKNLVEFSENIKGIHAGKISAAANLMTGLSQLLSSIPKEKGIFEALFTGGDKSLKKFGEQLPGFGKAIMGFATEVKELDGSTVENAVNAAKLLSELEQGLKEHGGLWQLIKGDSNLGQFGGNMELLGDGISAFVKSIKKDDGTSISEADIAGPRAALDLLSEFEQGLKEHNGLWQLIKGDSDLGSFGNSLKSLGEGLKSYVGATSSITEEDVTSSTRALDVLNQFEQTLQNHGGLKALWEGDNSLAMFGDNIGSVGEALSNFVDLTSEIPNITLKDAMATGRSILSMIRDFSTMNYAQLSAAVSNTNTLINNITNGLSKPIDESKTDLKTMYVETLEGISKACDEYKGKFESYGSEIMISVAKGMKNSINYFFEFFATLVGAVNTNVSKGIALFETTGKDIVSSIIKGIKNNNDDITNEILAAVKTACDIIETDDVYAPRIRPVLDFSELQNGAWGINTPYNSMGLVASVSNKMSTPESVMTREDINSIKNKLDSIIDKVDGTTINNEFNISNSDPDAVADKVSRIIRQQRDRRLAVAK